MKRKGERRGRGTKTGREKGIGQRGGERGMREKKDKEGKREG